MNGLKIDFSNKNVLILDGKCKIGKKLIEQYRIAGAKVLYFFKTSGKEHHYELMETSEDGNRNLDSLYFTYEGSEVFIQNLFSGIERLDIVINNMESKNVKDLFDITLAEWEESLFINHHIPFMILKGATPLLKQSEAGSIVNLTSPDAINGGNGAIAYAASKSALDSLNKGLSRSLGSAIRTNAVSYQTRDILEPTVTNMIMFLSSPHALYMNGQVILADGGKALS